MVRRGATPAPIVTLVARMVDVQFFMIVAVTRDDFIIITRIISIIIMYVGTVVDLLRLRLPTPFRFPPLFLLFLLLLLLVLRRDDGMDPAEPHGATIKQFRDPRP